MASSIPTARTSLVTILEALQATTLAGVAVIRSGTAKPRDTEIIVVQNATQITRDPINLGGFRFDERYLIPVRVEVFKKGADIQAAETRMWQLVTIVEQAVMATKTLAGAVSSALPDGIPEGEDSGPVDDRSVAAGLTLNVACWAQVTLT